MPRQAEATTTIKVVRHELIATNVIRGDGDRGALEWAFEAIGHAEQELQADYGLADRTYSFNNPGGEVTVTVRTSL